MVRDPTRCRPYHRNAIRQAPRCRVRRLHRNNPSSAFSRASAIRRLPRCRTNISDRADRSHRKECSRPRKILTRRRCLQWVSRKAPQCPKGLIQTPAASFRESSYPNIYRIANRRPRDGMPCSSKRKRSTSKWAILQQAIWLRSSDTLEDKCPEYRDSIQGCSGT